MNNQGIPMEKSSQTPAGAQGAQARELPAERPNPRAIAILRQARVRIRANGGNRRSCKDALKIYGQCVAPELPLLVFWLYERGGGFRALTDSNWEKYRMGFRIEDMATA